METMQDSGGLHVDGSKGSVASGLPSSKTANQLKIVESCDESGKLLTATKSEMDPYKELELYLAKVNVSLSFHLFLRDLYYRARLFHRGNDEICIEGSEERLGRSDRCANEECLV
ncbi:hypothetical protein WN48_00780 [Eufriesea mexicana]|uniref:Uncharacterized protein n=1 Tax=Eufriesea mexicana TaxID=516756 RepID=A0A310SQQ3_9HYME|nr:hypothetical protein WN48_00780 [Eufriesea mexicana]